MSIEALLTHRADVQELPATPLRDASGGILDASWQLVATDVPCAITAMSASRMADFAIAGEKVTHTVITLRSDLKLGQRLKVVDPVDASITYLRVGTVKHIRQRGSIGPFWEIAAEEVRLI